mmetsp:Transcript_32246/g.53291  ORF Transcript_32246/g.53291 Transcript_32246/m.53291 type:complete len:137 (-) Transcript_32246:182-592(-)
MPASIVSRFTLPALKTREVASKSNKSNNNNSSATTLQRKPTVMDCKRWIGAPMTKEQATLKLDSCPRFRQLTHDSPQGFAGLARSRSRVTTPTKRKIRPTFTGELVNRAIALDYGNRLRACLIQTKNRKSRHSTPY